MAERERLHFFLSFAPSQFKVFTPNRESGSHSFLTSCNSPARPSTAPALAPRWRWLAMLRSRWGSVYALLARPRYLLRAERGSARIPQGSTRNHSKWAKIQYPTEKANYCETTIQYHSVCPYGVMGYQASQEPSKEFINTTRPDPQPRYRLEFIQDGALVKAWPSRDPTYPKRCGGGKWIKLATIPELDFLGLDRFQQIEASTNKIEEDAFAEKMRLIGARWQAHITQIITL
ncbi:hypothetical protein TEQG_05909 [Trichophyton equinum CBS 127.97]|uniref:Uncharacterized protein n=1 Tax=Trichophyton equinum (strain ATCC MYA-4606 / CBS 127.97) TaxID=559882 RepID=F2PY85_TRIEC|nr:hypothetical protein TEQG_05909 [Trichophyton equinum CBS 127.97]